MNRLDLGCALNAGMCKLPEGATAENLVRTDAEVGLAMFAAAAVTARFVMRLVARLNAVPALNYDVYTSALPLPVASEGTTHFQTRSLAARSKTTSVRMR
ncbi:hypothetical protein [Rhodococcus erythropolis]|uniref:hypothetical protein n=1 Tax=Rhodococcus erythropolis TaxID=1833 RepID=UPI0022272F2E|nr:hypothetical protein [Rhodococcus erythropolis]MCW2295505.1 short-subunit dehydrogenase involved in D-alanine esterification of teichoic acids [Rhodococcus erythropolis]